MFQKRMNPEKRRKMEQAKRKTKPLANYFDFLAIVTSGDNEKAPGFEVFTVPSVPEFKSWVAVSRNTTKRPIIVRSNKEVTKDYISRSDAVRVALTWLFRKYLYWQWQQNGGAAQFEPKFNDEDDNVRTEKKEGVIVE